MILQKYINSTLFYPHKYFPLGWGGGHEFSNLSPYPTECYIPHLFCIDQSVLEKKMLTSTFWVIMI